MYNPMSGKLMIPYGDFDFEKAIEDPAYLPKYMEVDLSTDHLIVADIAMDVFHNHSAICKQWFGGPLYSQMVFNTPIEHWDFKD